MARISSIGSELLSVATGVEITATSGSPTVSTSIVRSGSAAFRANPSSGTVYVQYTFDTIGSGPDVSFYRILIRAASLPSSEEAYVFTLDGDDSYIGVRLTSAGALKLWNTFDNAQIGSTTSNLITVGSWHRLEIGFDITTSSSTSVTLKHNGTTVASGTVDFIGFTGPAEMRVGALATSSGTTADLYFDDIAINDNSGSFQNSYPGEGKIIRLRPNAAGDNSDWTNDYQNVDEVTPDDGTTLVSSNTLDQIDDHNIEPPVYLGTEDTINVVQVGVRFNGAGASSNASFVLRIKASASGTVEESSAITPSNTTWVTNAAASPRNYALTLYDLPGASTTAWTKADLETAQIGYRLSASSTNAAQISTVWLLVDYTPVTGSEKIALRSKTTNSAASGTAVSVALPADGETGDLLMVVISHNDGTVTVADNNGGTAMTEDFDSGNDSGGEGVAIYTRELTGSEPATLNFTLSASNRWAVTAFIFTGWHGTTIYDVVIDTFDYQLSTTAPTSAQCTTVTNNAWTLSIIAVDSNTVTITGGPESPFFELATVNTQQPLAVYAQEKATAGATGTATFAISGAVNVLGMRQFAIKPFVAAAGGTAGNDWPAFQSRGFWGWRF